MILKIRSFEPIISLGDSSVDKVSAVNILGLSLVNKLNWCSRIEKMAKKVGKNLFVLRHLVKYLPRDTNRKVYFVLILSHISYGIFNCGEAPPNIICKKFLFCKSRPSGIFTV